MHFYRGFYLDIKRNYFKIPRVCCFLGKGENMVQKNAKKIASVVKVKKKGTVQKRGTVKIEAKKSQKPVKKTMIKAIVPKILTKGRRFSPSLRELVAFALGVVFMGCFSYMMVHHRMDRDFKITQKRLSYLHFVIQKDYEEALMACGCAPGRPCPRLTEGLRRQYMKKPMPQDAKRRIPFPEAEYVSYARPGDKIVAGNVCKSLPKGYICPDKIHVFANPVTSYSNEWYHRHWAGKEILEDPDRRAWWFHRSTKTNATGRFALTQLPAGVYYIGAELCARSAKNPQDRKCTPMRLAQKVHVYKDRMNVRLKVVSKGEEISEGGCGCGARRPVVKPVQPVPADPVIPEIEPEADPVDLVDIVDIVDVEPAE